MERALRNSLSEIFNTQALQHCPNLEASTNSAISCLWWQNSRQAALKKFSRLCYRVKRAYRREECQNSRSFWVWNKARYYWLACLSAKQQLLQFSAMITCQTLPAETQQELKTAALHKEKILPWLTKKNGWVGEDGSSFSAAWLQDSWSWRNTWLLLGKWKLWSR